MFNKPQGQLIAAQNATLAAQASTIKGQAEALSVLLRQSIDKEREIAALRQSESAQAARITQLEGYLKDLGIDTAVLDANQFWWPQARKAVAVSVDRSLLAGDPSFANEQQREFVAHLAAAAVATSDN